MKGIAEGTYNTKHAEAARLYYTTMLLDYYTTTNTLTPAQLTRLHELAEELEKSAQVGARISGVVWAVFGSRCE